MIVAVTPLATIALTAFLVNFRHIFYAFTFPLHVVRNRFARAYSVYTLVDEAYAVTAANPRGWTSWRLVTMQAAFQCYWVGGGLTGVLLGSMLPARIEGLEFALCALFVTLTLDACRSRDGVPSLLLAALSFSMFVGLLLFIATLVARYLLVRRQVAVDA